MKLNKKGKVLCAAMSIMALSFAMTGEAADKQALLADGELFVSSRVNAGAKVLYDGKLDKSSWAMPQGKGIPKDFGGAAFIYGKDLPQVATAKDTKPINKTADMIEAAKTKYAVSTNANSLIVYVTTGPSDASTDIAISSIKLYGRLLNVVVALKNADVVPPNQMNIMYPQQMVAIPLKKLPKYGNLRIRFADLNGQALANSEILLAR